MATVTTSYNNWKFNTQHVQQNLTGGDFVGSHTVILCATGPKLSAMSAAGTGFGSIQGSINKGISQAFGGYEEVMSADAAAPGFAIPIGVVSDVGIQAQRQINKIYEIGSKLSYTVSARTNIGINFSRVLYHGPSVLRMLYAYYPYKKLGGTGNELADMPKYGDSKMSPVDIDQVFSNKLPQIKETPGHNNVFLNAASDLFSQPLGLVMYIKDNTSADVAAIFYEDCNLVSHQFALSQGAVVVAESVSLTADNMHPLKVNVAPVANALGLMGMAMPGGMGIPGLPGIPGAPDTA